MPAAYSLFHATNRTSEKQEREINSVHLYVSGGLRVAVNYHRSRVGKRGMKVRGKNHCILQEEEKHISQDTISAKYVILFDSDTVFLSLYYNKKPLQND